MSAAALIALALVLTPFAILGIAFAVVCCRIDTSRAEPPASTDTEP